MMPNITTLVDDINDVIKGLKGWDKAIGSHMGDAIADIYNNRFGKPQEPRGYLSMSSLGTVCDRKLWYKINKTELGEPLQANALLKFSYGDMLEELMLCLVEQAGHTVTGKQDRMEAHGIKGSRDCVIDGMTVDIKSASSFSFQKFKNNELRTKDPFGYISQLSSYVYAAKNDPLVENKTHGSFLVVDKVNGSICLDTYDFTEELEKKEEDIKRIKAVVKNKLIPNRGFEDEPQTKTSPNRKLCMTCSYCEFKKACHPNLKLFKYANGPVYLTKVAKHPNIAEAKNW